MADIALTNSELTASTGQAPARPRAAHPDSPLRQAGPAPWSPRYKLIFLLTSASGLWALIGLGLWSLL